MTINKTYKLIYTDECGSIVKVGYDSKSKAIGEFKRVKGLVDCRQVILYRGCIELDRYDKGKPNLYYTAFKVSFAFYLLTIFLASLLYAINY